ncbi:MAG TPA: long-chain fatty acid--CoA ligase [Bacteroidales bacterium]|nr:long-chain fatty acid--CoA ligase [Bacteroidales bacterium]
MKPVTRIFDLLELYRDEYRSKRGAFHRRIDGKWIAYSSEDYIRYSRDLGLGLMSLGVKRGTRIATVLKNCPEWNFLDMGILMAGAVQVPVYPTVSEENYRYILNDAGVEYLFVYDLEIYRRVRNICREVPTLKGVYSIDKIRGLPGWREIAEKGRAQADPSRLEKICESILPGEMATIIYTSGTTGRPKGVMLSHENFITNFMACARIPDFTMKDRVLSFLPLCHVYERMLNYMHQYFGMSVYYVDDLDQLAECLKEVRPVTFDTVPRILEKIYDRIVTRGRNLKWPRRVIFFWALRQGHKFELDHVRGRVYDVKLWFANLLVFIRWRKALGGRIRIVVSGGASLHPRLARIFWAARIPVMEGYGLTETSPVIAVYTFDPGGVKFGTVGRVIPGVRVQIAEDGEILCKGPNVMLGYYNRPERTREVIDPDGWFHTGDIGQIEDGEYLRITDRKKEIFKTSSGKYISPQAIEQRFKESPFIEHIIIIGENRKYTAALIVPNFEHLRSWCALKKVPFISFDQVIANARIRSRIKREVDRFNLDLGQTEKIKKFRLLADEWKVETGELSPTLKLRRKFIQEKYRQVIDETYRSQEFNYRIEEDQ